MHSRWMRRRGIGSEQVNSHDALFIQFSSLAKAEDFWRHIALWEGRGKGLPQQLRPTVNPLYFTLKSYSFSSFGPTLFLLRILYCLIFYIELTGRAVQQNGFHPAPLAIHTASSLLSPARLSATANIFRSAKPQLLMTLAAGVGMCHTADCSRIQSLKSHCGGKVVIVKTDKERNTLDGKPILLRYKICTLAQRCYLVS